MDEHERQKRAELADGVGQAVDALVSRAANEGTAIHPGRAVQQLLAEFPDAETSAAELAEALIRAAASRGLAVAVNRAE